MTHEQHVNSTRGNRAGGQHAGQHTQKNKGMNVACTSPPGTLGHVPPKRADELAKGGDDDSHQVRVVSGRREVRSAVPGQRKRCTHARAHTCVAEPRRASGLLSGTDGLFAELQHHSFLSGLPRQ